jgi:hypothetical protein
MPNWCLNTVTLEHDDPEMIARAKTSFAEGKFLNEFIPVPEDLKITAGFLGDSEEQRKLEEQTTANLERYGYSSWYDFCVNEWGTKWDVGGDGAADDIENGLMLSFDSAWAPPIAAYDKLLAMGFRIYATYYEPGMAFAGEWDNGDDRYYDYSGLDSAGIAELLPAELDEAYCISEDAAQWEEENKEEEQE